MRFFLLSIKFDESTQGSRLTCFLIQHLNPFEFFTLTTECQCEHRHTVTVTAQQWHVQKEKDVYGVEFSYFILTLAERPF